MLVLLGEEVVGTDGKLGIIDGIAIDPKSQTAEQIVMKSGFPVSHNRLIVLGHTTNVEDNAVHVDLSRKEVDSLELYDSDAYHAPDPGGIDPADYNRAVPGAGKATLAETGASEPPQEFPQFITVPDDDQAVPRDERLTVVADGTDVWDSDGKKIGDVHDFAVETSTGKPTRLTIKRGFFASDQEIPVEWVQQYSPKGVLLKVPLKQVQALKKSERES